MIETLAAFALTSLAIELTPGPNMAYLAVLSLERGRAAGLAAVAGVALGLLGLGLVAGLGFGSVIMTTRWLYEALRWGGMAFLLYLAWDAYRESRQPLADAETAQRLGEYFRRGPISNLLNPKAALFYVAVMPSFIDAAQPQLRQALTLTFIYVAVATMVHAAIALGAGMFQPLLASSGFRRPLGIGAALVLVAIAIWLGVATRRAW